MRQANIVLDLYSGAICLILFCYLLFGKGRRDKLRLYFLLMCAFNFGMSVCDVPNWAFEGFARPWYPAALWTGSLIYYLCSGPLLLAFTGYIIEFLAPKVTVRPAFFRLAAVLCAVQVAASLLSPSVGRISR